MLLHELIVTVDFGAKPEKFTPSEGKSSQRIAPSNQLTPRTTRDGVVIDVMDTDPFGTKNKQINNYDGTRNARRRAWVFTRWIKDYHPTIRGHV